MRTIAKAAIAAGFFCWASFAPGRSMAQGPYCYFDWDFNARVCIPHHRYYQPQRYFPNLGRAYYGDPSCYPQYGICCPAGFVLKNRVCVPIGW
jgi:hypothetical protein